jgi:hypothetical protein
MSDQIVGEIQAADEAKKAQAAGRGDVALLIKEQEARLKLLKKLAALEAEVRDLRAKLGIK